MRRKMIRCAYGTRQRARQAPEWDRPGYSDHVMRDTVARAKKLQSVQHQLRDEVFGG